MKNVHGCIAFRNNVHGYINLLLSNIICTKLSLKKKLNKCDNWTSFHLAKMQIKFGQLSFLSCKFNFGHVSSNLLSPLVIPPC